MAFYKVLVIKMLLTNNKVVKRNDIIDESLVENARNLEKNGYIAKASKKEIDDFKSKKTESINENKPAGNSEKSIEKDKSEKGNVDEKAV